MLRPLPREIGISRASLLPDAILLRGVQERISATSISRDTTEATPALERGAEGEKGCSLPPASMSYRTPAQVESSAWEIHARRGRPRLFLTTVFECDMLGVLQQLPWTSNLPHR